MGMGELKIPEQNREQGKKIDKYYEKDILLEQYLKIRCILDKNDSCQANVTSWISTVTNEPCHEIKASCLGLTELKQLSSIAYLTYQDDCIFMSGKPSK